MKYLLALMIALAVMVAGVEVGSAAVTTSDPVLTSGVELTAKKPTKKKVVKKKPAKKVAKK